jgi:hypothetical protein
MKLVGSIYGRSSIKNAQFVLIRSQTWPPQAIGEDFLEIDQSETRIACGGHIYQRIGTK